MVKSTQGKQGIRVSIKDLERILRKVNKKEKAKKKKS
jgi:hypothetical protein